MSHMEINRFPRGRGPAGSSQVQARIAILVTAPLALWLADNILVQYSPNPGSPQSPSSPPPVSRPLD